jgi:hypothetical protein
MTSPETLTSSIFDFQRVVQKYGQSQIHGITFEADVWDPQWILLIKLGGPKGCELRLLARTQAIRPCSGFPGARRKAD